MITKQGLDQNGYKQQFVTKWLKTFEPKWLQKTTWANPFFTWLLLSLRGSIPKRPPGRSRSITNPGETPKSPSKVNQCHRWSTSLQPPSRHRHFHSSDRTCPQTSRCVYNASLPEIFPFVDGKLANVTVRKSGSLGCKILNKFANLGAQILTTFANLEVWVARSLIPSQILKSGFPYFPCDFARSDFAFPLLSRILKFSVLFN